MLDYAYFHQGELFECLKKTVRDKNLYFYLMYPAKFFSFRIDENDRDSIQFVSLASNNKVIGFFAAYADNTNNLIYNMDFINFTGKINSVFSKDVKMFFDEIFINRNFRKINFYAIEKNPAVKMYRKLIKKLGGREAGILKENKKLTDGNYYDEVIFEVFKDDYLGSTK
jgi:hypothetical protein